MLRSANLGESHLTPPHTPERWAGATGSPLAASGSPRRGVTVGFVGTASSGRRIMQVAERMDSSIRLVSAISDDARGARPKALQIAGESDVILFSGPLAYDLAVAQGNLSVPSVYVPPGGPALPTALLRAVLHEKVDLRQLSIDSLPEYEVHEAYEELEVDVSGVHVMNYRESATSADFLRFHRKLHQDGKTVAAVTTLPEVAEELNRLGTPALTMRPDFTTLRTALNTAVLVGGGASLDNERIAVIFVRVPESLTPRHKGTSISTFVELKLGLLRELMREARRMDASVFPRDDAGVLVFVSMGSLRAMTDDLATIPFAERIRAVLGFAPDIGIGVGRTVAEAEANAEEAADNSADTGELTAFMVGPGGARARIPRGVKADSPSSPPKEQPREREAEVLHQVLRALDRAGEESRIVEAEQVAELLGVTLRTARRYLRSLVEADFAWELPPAQTNRVGRPPIPFRLLEHRLRK